MHDHTTAAMRQVKKSGIRMDGLLDICLILDSKDLILERNNDV